MKTAFELEELRVDPATGEVSGPGGSEKLDPKVMDALLTLADRPGEVVTREALHARLWPNAVVTDDALTRCFYELRRQLSRAGGDERYRDLLETLPKRGYRLKGRVRTLEPSASSAPPAAAPGRRDRRFVLAAVAIAALAALAALAIFLGLRDPGTPPAQPAPADGGEHSIAVLPFVDMSEAGDQRYFSDGISEEILNRLAQSPGLRVISRTSSFTCRGESADIPELARKLDVSHVLEGSVRKSGERVRITAQLIDAATNSHVWSDTYDREMGDVFQVQDDIAAKVAKALDATLSGAQAAAPKPAAYERYLQGRYFYDRRAPGDIDLMAKYLEEAVEIDPGFARGWAELAGAYRLLSYEQPESAAEFRAKQGEAARRAVTLDPGLAPAHLRMAQFHWLSGNQADGDAHFDRAFAIDPHDVLLLSMQAGHALWEGDLDAAVAFQREALARDPLSAVQHGNLASYLGGAGRFEESLAERRIAAELSPVSEPGDDSEMVRLLVLLGRLDEASAIAARMPEGAHRDFALALIDEPHDRRAQADAALERLAARPPVMEEAYLPEVYAHRGMNDAAFEAIRQMRDAIGSKAIHDFEQNYELRQALYLSPLLIPLHDDPRWKEVIAGLKLPSGGS